MDLGPIKVQEQITPVALACPSELCLACAGKIAWMRPNNSNVAERLDDIVVRTGFQTWRSPRLGP